MNLPSKSQQLYLDYVLGQLPVDERERIDSALIEDQEFSDSFQESRLDLLDAYAANELSLEVRRQVERGILSTGDRNRGMRIATAIQSAGTAGSEVRIRSQFQYPANRRPMPGARVRSFRIKIFASVLAACSILAVVLVRQHKRNLASVNSVQPASAYTASNTPPSVTDAQALESSEPAENASSIPSRRTLTGPKVMAFVLPQANNRGAGRIPLQIHPGIEQVRIQWPLPSDASVNRYVLSISSDGHNLASLPQHGRVADSGGIQIAIFLLKAKALPDGEYIFRLQSMDAPERPVVAESSVKISH